MDYIAITTNNYLEHHGILGQKWGIRRYQNADGTLTDAGKKRQDEIKEKYKDAKKVGTSALKVAVGTKLASVGVKTYSDLVKKFGIKNLYDMIVNGSTITSTTPTGLISYSFKAAQDIPVLAANALGIVGGIPLAAIGATGLIAAGASIVSKHMNDKDKNDKTK